MAVLALPAGAVPVPGSSGHRPAVDRVPLTEQGKPSRPAFRAAAHAMA